MQQRLDQARQRQRWLINENSRSDAVAYRLGQQGLGPQLGPQRHVAGGFVEGLHLHEGKVEPGLHDVRHLDVAADQAVQPPGGAVLLARLKWGDDAFHRKAHPGEDHPQQRLLAADIGVDGTDAEPAGLGQIAGGGGVKTLAAADVEGGEQDLFQIGDGHMWLLYPDRAAELAKQPGTEHRRGQVLRAQLRQGCRRRVQAGLPDMQAQS